VVQDICGGKCVAQDILWWEVCGARYFVVGSVWRNIFSVGKCVAQDILWWELCGARSTVLRILSFI
jgi:hypothetical protein